MRLLPLLFLPAFAYQTLSIVASLAHLRRRRAFARAQPDFSPPVSVLKPVRGLDPNTVEAFVSQAQQNYPCFELLFGVASADDPAVSEVERLRQQFPHASIRLIVGSSNFLNAKVAILANLARHARYQIWVVNDSDIEVGPNYLRQVVAPLASSSIGVVTCLYRVRAHTAAARWEALGIACDFIPSTLVAQLLGVREFGLGSTLAFRADDLRRAGGFDALGGFLADDYQLAKGIVSFGKRTLLSTFNVETSLGESTWRGGWHHQVRWARTIRTSKGAGYAGLPITHAGVWLALALLLRLPRTAAALLASRLVSASLSSFLVLESRQTAALFWLAPLWDLYSFAVWLTSYAGRKVRWRDRTLTIDKSGRIGPE